MLKSRNLLFVNLALLLIAIAVLFYSFSRPQKIVYVDNIKIFDGFVMTKELKRVGEKEFNRRKSILDTLYTNIQSASLSQSEREKMMPTFLEGKENLENFNKTFGIEESKQIWARIHTYTKQFAEDKGYQFVIGSDNNKPVYYSDENSDITNELLFYINNKYDGK